MTPLALLPLVAGAMFALLCKKRGASWCWSYILAAVGWGVTVTAITEGLSVFGALTFHGVLGLWAAVVVASALLCWMARPVPAPDIPALDSSSWVAAFVLTAIMGVLAIIALVAPPNTTDSMAYHMSRVMHWIQNAGVADYPTHIARQLYQPPWAEFAIAQVQLLTSGDRFANLVQWFSMAGSLVGVSLITKQLGGDRRCQILAALVAATVPMGILQASGTQNDYVTSFWLVCFVNGVLALDRPEAGPGHWARAGFAGASLGLAILTKATAYLFALPFGAWVALIAARRRGPRALATIAVVVVTAGVLNAGHYWRNAVMYGSVLGPGHDGSFVYANDVFSVTGLASNIVRNAAIHVGVPGPDLRARVARGVVALHVRAGVDANDRRTTWGGWNFELPPRLGHEDYAGNLLHFGLIVLTIVVGITSRRVRRRDDCAIYATAVTLGFLLFCFYLKWQPWHSRLHLPLFVLWSPLVAIVFGRWRTVSALGAATLVVAAIPWLLSNGSRPLVGEDSIFVGDRTGQYFVNHPPFREPYTNAMRVIGERGCADVGLVLHTIYGWEYPLWILSKRFGVEGTRFEHVDVGNESAAEAHRLPFSSFSPCAIIAVEMPVKIDDKPGYHLKLAAGPVVVYMRQ